MNCKKRWIDNLRRKFGLAHFARPWLEAAHVDPLACTSSSRKAFLHIGEAGVGAEVYEELSRRRGRTPSPGNGEDGQESEQGSIADIFHELFFLTPPLGGIEQNQEILLMRWNDCMGVVVPFGESGKIKELYRLVAGIDIGVNGGRIRRQHVSHARPLNAQLRPQKHQTGAINRRPDFFLSWSVRMRFAHRQRIDRYSNDALLR